MNTPDFKWYGTVHYYEFLLKNIKLQLSGYGLFIPGDVIINVFIILFVY